MRANHLATTFHQAAQAFEQAESKLSGEVRETALFQAYTSMRQIFEAILGWRRTVHDVWGSEMGTEMAYPPTFNYVQNPTRTIIMLSALTRLIGHHEKEHRGTNIAVTELGCGVGFFACFATAIRESIRVIAIDSDLEAVEAAREAAKALDLKKRIDVQQRDAFQNPLTEPTDIVVAEHLSRALANEHSAKLPRTISDAPPNCFTPYSATPRLIFGPKLHATLTSFLGGPPAMTINPEELQLFTGREIILANPSSPEMVELRAHISFPPGITPIWVANDIRWLSPEVSTDPRFTQTTEAFLQQWLAKDYTRMDQFLLGPIPLPTLHHFMHYHGIRNLHSEPITATITVRYEIGYKGQGINRNPEKSSKALYITISDDRLTPCSFTLGGAEENTMYLPVEKVTS